MMDMAYQQLLHPSKTKDEEVFLEGRLILKTEEDQEGPVPDLVTDSNTDQEEEEKPELTSEDESEDERETTRNPTKEDKKGRKADQQGQL